jgi:hypothetical protein
MVIVFGMCDDAEVGWGAGGGWREGGGGSVALIKYVVQGEQ